MKIKIRYILAVISIVIISLAIVNIVEDKDEEVVKGNITIWADSYTYEYLSTCADEFMELNNKAEIEVVEISTAEYESQVNEAIETGNLPDIIQGDSGYLRTLQEEYVDKVSLSDNLSAVDVDSKNYVKSRLSEIKSDSDLLGVPLTSRPLVLYLREDLLEQYGYNNDDIVTWNDLITVGKDIYEKSGGTIKVLNAIDEDYDDLISLLIMQAMEETTNKDEIYQYVDTMINTLTENNILNTSEYGEYIARISSINAVRELQAIEEECSWTSNNVPSKSSGSNRFYVAEGENLAVLTNDEKNDKLINKFIEYLSTNTKSKYSHILNGDFFLSFTATYNYTSIESSINNFIGQSPIVVMDNVQDKAPSLENYDLYFSIKKSYT